MQAMTVTTRTIPNNPFFDEIKKREMQRHTEKVNEIMTLRHQKLKTMEVQSQKIAGVLKKAKQAAKQFQSKQKELTRKKQNKILLQKLWRISQTRLHTTSQFLPIYKHINHRAEQQRRISARIQQQNRYLTKNLIQQSRHKRSKTQIKSEIKEYLMLRDSIRKKMSPDEMRRSRKRLEKSKSEMKGMRTVSGGMLEGRELREKREGVQVI